MKCLRGKTSEHRVSRRRHSGGPFETLDKSFAAGQRPGEFELAFLAGGLS